MEHYVTLVSNASMDIFPDNKLSSFRTRLPYVHDFSDGEWLVALTELTYTKSWFNVTEGAHVSPAFMDTGELVGGGMASAAKSKIKPGYYVKTQDLIDHINSVMNQWPRGPEIVQQPVLHLKSNQKVALKQTGVFKLNEYVSRDYGALFDRELQSLLGIKDDRAAFLDQGLTSLFIYADIIKPQVVGDSLSPLLRTVGVNSDVDFGQNVTEIFESPYYLPLSQTRFQEISINIRGDTGEAPYFQFGRTAVTLHFVRQ
jgi:hypothetical protein